MEEKIYMNIRQFWLDYRAVIVSTLVIGGTIFFIYKVKSIKPINVENLIITPDALNALWRNEPIIHMMDIPKPPVV